MFNSLGFVALVVFAAVLLTSVLLAAPPVQLPVTAGPGKVHEHMTPPAQRFEQLIRQRPLQDEYPPVF